MNDSDIIAELGGTAALSKTLGLTCHQVVTNWRRRGIPYRWRPAVAELALNKGLKINKNEFLGIPTP